jgi:protein-L-isoaspartate(D-aspartate) O-methyltransferase
MAALLSNQAQQVTTIEIRPGLIKLAQDNLQQAGIRNVTVNQGDGLSLDGWSNRQFDAVLVSGGLPFLPDPLRALLKTGGRLIAIIGEAPVMRAMRIERRPEGFVEEGLFETLIPMLDNIPPMSRFRF